jgi:MFS transporter, DHA3 family, tetracycline resistance protein
LLLRQPLIRKLNPYAVWMSFEGFSSFAFALTFTVSMIYMVKNVGLNPLEMVLVGTVLEIACFLFEIPTGVVADTYSRRVSVIIGSVLMGIGFIVQGAFVSFMAVLLAQIFWGIGATFHSGASHAWLTDEIGEKNVGKTLLRGGQVARVGGFFGIIVSVLIALMDIQLAIVAGGVMHLLVALFLLLYMPEDGYQPTPPTERESWSGMFTTFRQGVTAVRGRPVLVTLLAVSLVFGAWSEGYDRLSTPHLLTNFTLPGLPDVMLFGLIDIVGMVIGIGFAEFARRRVQLEEPRAIAKALIIINGLMIAAIFTFAFAGNLLVALLALWALGQLRGLQNPLGTTWINQGLGPNVRATVLSMESQVNAFGQIGGGPVIGAIGNSVSLRAALGLGGFILAPVLLLYAQTLKGKQSALNAQPSAAGD